MRSLRVSLALATLLLLSATKVSAQSSRMACKDGSQPKIGHFACWGHGGLVEGKSKSAEKVARKPEAKKVKKTVAPAKAKKPTAKQKKAHASLAKGHKKPHPKRKPTHTDK